MPLVIVLEGSGEIGGISYPTWDYHTQKGVLQSYYNFGNNAIRGSRVGSGPMGESERGDSAPRTVVSYWCARGHETRPARSRVARTG